jgi:hypothetical protein
LSSWLALNRLGQMRRSDFVTTRQIGNRACDFEDTVECSGAELKLLHRRAHERLARRVEADKLIISNLNGDVTRTVKGLVLVQAPPFTDYR